MPNTDQACYSALRHGGASQARACAEMDVSSGRGVILERIFNLREHRGGADGMRPAFARHGRHVAAVLAGGGYPVLTR